jgi:diguanylate cyclase (GGDEF)-like protein
VQLVNGRFFVISGLPAGSIGPGMTVSDVTDIAVNHGLYPDEDPAEVCIKLTSLLTKRRSMQIEMAMRPGLLVRVASEPMVASGTVVTFEDVTEKRRNEEQIVFMARHDALTSLPNRTLFQDYMDAAVAGLDEGQQFAVLCIDLDRFKEVNDTLGHAAGDELLRLVAGRLRRSARDHDVVARLGGDEFAIVIANEAGCPAAPMALAARPMRYRAITSSSARVSASRCPSRPCRAASCCNVPISHCITQRENAAPSHSSSLE